MFPQFTEINRQTNTPHLQPPTMKHNWYLTHQPNSSGFELDPDDDDVIIDDNYENFDEDDDYYY